MTNELFIDCSLFNCFVYLKTDNKEYKKEFSNRFVLELLMYSCLDLLNKANLTYKDLSDLYVVEGIGFSTGLRLQITFAKILMLLNSNLKVHVVNYFKEAKSYSNKIPCILDRRGNYLCMNFTSENEYELSKVLSSENTNNLILITDTETDIEKLSPFKLLVECKKDKVITKETIGHLKPIYFEI